MHKILITTSSFGKNDSEPLELLKNHGFEITLNPYGRKLSEEETAKLVEANQPLGMVAGVEALTRAVLEAAKNLKVISRAGIGMDSVNLDAARDLGIVVINTPDAPTTSVAELTLGMILTLLREIHLSDAGIRNGKWYRPMGNLLSGKTMGLIGCGRIGSCLARMLLPFGCVILGCDPACSGHQCLEIIDLGNLLRQSDIVSLHLPYSRDTHYFMNKKRLAAMKKGSFLINASRGGLVDETALFDILKSKHLAGAAIDSFEQEPYAGPLKELNNVLLTAHIGSYAKEGRVMMEKQAVENLLRELKKAGCIQ